MYNGFGVLESQTNAAVDCVFGFAGGAYDSATGKENFDNRWYEAITGRWLSKDPIKMGTNFYCYCGNAPIIYVDPSGLAQYWGGNWNPLNWFTSPPEPEPEPAPLPRRLNPRRFPRRFTLNHRCLGIQ